MIALDSSFLLCFQDESDPRHPSARAAMGRFLDGTWGKGLLLEYVLVDVLTALKQKRSPAVAIEAGNLLWRSREVEFVPSAEHFRTFWNEFQADYLSPLTFVDHAVAAIARQRCGGKVLSFNPALSALPGIAVEPGQRV